LLCQRFKKKSKHLFLKTDGAGNLSFSSDLPTTSFTGATVETSIADSDLVLIYDDSATAVRKMTKANLVAGIGASAGQVIQVIQADYTGNVNTTSTSYVTSNLTASITPASASNKILIMVTLGDVYETTTNQVARSMLYRGSSPLLSSGGSPSFASSYSTSGGLTVNHNFQYLDSPATTSSTTYTVYFRSEGGTVHVNVNGGTSFIQLLEVKG